MQRTDESRIVGRLCAYARREGDNGPQYARGVCIYRDASRRDGWTIVRIKTRARDGGKYDYVLRVIATVASEFGLDVRRYNTREHGGSTYIGHDEVVAITYRTGE